MGQKVIIVKSNGDLVEDLRVYNNFKKSNDKISIHCFDKINKYILENYGTDVSTDREVEIFTRILEIFYQQDSFWYVKFVLEELERQENEPIVYVFSLNFTTPILLRKFISNTQDIKFVKSEDIEDVIVKSDKRGDCISEDSSKILLKSLQKSTIFNKGNLELRYLVYICMNHLSKIIYKQRREVLTSCFYFLMI